LAAQVLLGKQPRLGLNGPLGTGGDFVVDRPEDREPGRE
jgi:hypothetical protein